MHKPNQSAHRAQSAHSLIARLGANEVVEGIYRFHSLNRKRTTDGVELWHVGLSDRSGVLDAWIPCAQTQNVFHHFIPDIPVFVRFKTRLHQGKLVADLIEFDPLTDVLDPALALDRLPRPSTRSAIALDALAGLLNDMQSTDLREAIDLLLVNDTLALEWISAPDGAFDRCVHAAAIATELPRLSREERQLLVVACLFKEIGALSLHDEWMRNFGQAPYVSPACLTLERVGPALQYLDLVNRDAARTLRQLWSLGLVPANVQTPMALALAMELATELAVQQHPPTVVSQAVFMSAQPRRH